jgi:hypothetical protein
MASHYSTPRVLAKGTQSPVFRKYLKKRWLEGFGIIFKPVEGRPLLLPEPLGRHFRKPKLWLPN